MAIKIKETPKPAINKKKHSNSPSVVSSTQKKKKDSAVVNKGKKNGTTAKAVNSGKPTVSEKVKLSDISVSSVCELKPTQVSFYNLFLTWIKLYLKFSRSKMLSRHPLKHLM